MMHHKLNLIFTRMQPESATTKNPLMEPARLENSEEVVFTTHLYHHQVATERIGCGVCISFSQKRAVSKLGAQHFYY